MKNLKRILCLCLSLMLLLSFPLSVSAADHEPEPPEVPGYLIDENAAASLTIFKFDFTNAAKDGVWNENSFVSTGWQESYVETTLGGGQDKSYAIEGVEFSYLRVADIVTFTEAANDGHEDYNLTQVLYGFDKNQAANLLGAIGLTDGAGRYENADNLDASKYYYTSDALNKAMAESLAANATTVKDALETYMADNGGQPMDLTDENGKTKAENLPLGLYLLVETAVPEMVTNTVNPFFVSLPMTTVSGDANSASPEGGHQWNYNVTVYPKNETGIPTLEKQVRESMTDTGKNNGSDSITDGFAHNATGSSGDTMEYQILSTLPTITSQATALTTYSFYDTLCEGLSYDQATGVKIEFFTDAACTDKATSWDMDSGMFTVTYSEDGRHMTVDMTQYGLNAINGEGPTIPKVAAPENINGILYGGFSNYTLRLTYSAKINSDTSFVYGEEGNDNKVVLTWKRTSSEYYDTLIDDTHVYSFGIDLTKAFSDKDAATAEEAGMYDHVKFKIKNTTDNYWLTAKLNEAEGIYYVTGRAADEASATVFTPVTSDNENGRVIVLGCEDDEYILVETETAAGYTLLKKDIRVTITASDDQSRVCDIYSEDVIGVLQNDPYYAYDGGLDLALANIPQKALAHNYMTATATIDGNKVNMRADDTSENAQAPLTIVNTKGFTLPKTGDNGTMMFTIAGILLMAGAAGVIVVACRKKKEI